MKVLILVFTLLLLGCSSFYDRHPSSTASKKYIFDAGKCYRVEKQKVHIDNCMNHESKNTKIDKYFYDKGTCTHEVLVQDQIENCATPEDVVPAEDSKIDH